MESEFTEIVTALGIGGMLGSIATLVLKDRLSRQKDGRKRRMATDRATYDERITHLIIRNLSSFIRSGRCRDGERESIAGLIDELANGAHHIRFLDKAVQELWEHLLKKSVECGRLRLSGLISDSQIAEYVKIWEQFYTAAKNSFGPITEADCPKMRKTTSEAVSHQEAA